MNAICIYECYSFCAYGALDGRAIDDAYNAYMNAICIYECYSFCAYGALDGRSDRLGSDAGFTTR